MTQHGTPHTSGVCAKKRRNQGTLLMCVCGQSSKKPPLEGDLRLQMPDGGGRSDRAQSKIARPFHAFRLHHFFQTSFVGPSADNHAYLSRGSTSTVSPPFSQQKRPKTGKTRLLPTVDGACVPSVLPAEPLLSHHKTSHAPCACWRITPCGAPISPRRKCLCVAVRFSNRRKQWARSKLMGERLFATTCHHNNRSRRYFPPITRSYPTTSTRGSCG